MRLEITVVGGPGSDTALPATELCASWQPGSPATGLSLEQALARRWPGHAFTVAGQPLPALAPGTRPLVDGAVAVAWPAPALPDEDPALRASDGSVAMPGHPSPRAASGQRCAALLVVVSGPGAGAVFELHRGSYTIGRGRCRISIPDPALSRHHCTLTVGSHSITLARASGAGSTVLNRRTGIDAGARPASAIRVQTAVPARGPLCVEVGQFISCGSSLLELRFQDVPATGTGRRAASANSGPVNGLAANLLDASVLTPLEVPRQGGPARGRMAAAATAAISLALGVVLAVTTGSWMFLSFSAMGALTLLVPLLGSSSMRKALRRSVDLAVEQDATRAASAFPDAGSMVLAAHGGAHSPARPRQAAGIAVRLGTGTRAAAIALVPMDPAFVPPQVPFLPVCVRVGEIPVEVRGPGTALHPLLHYLLMQLDAAAVPVVVLGPAQELPLAARLLPFTTLAASTNDALRALAELRRPSLPGGATPSPVLVALNAAIGPPLRDLPEVAQVHFLELSRDRPGPALRAGSATAMAATVALTASGSRIRGTMDAQDFVPDGVQAPVFAAYARLRAGAASSPSTQQPTAGADPAGGRALAANVLPEPDSSTPAGLRRNWDRSAGGPLRPVPVGRSAAGTLLFDFRSDGPHLLLAGTTGSGKSEFLRTLVGSLAIAHSPADLQFVFIDFKGGAGLGALAKLPHTSSLITDLGGHGMDRTLCSLRAELHRREAALAQAEAADSEEYRALLAARDTSTVSPHPRTSHTMAHLIIVIDEFRVLVDQFPDAMAELMRIAAVGRSLGIHLVMATQRPQGALNADIRANVTSSICLRVQSALDSVDVIGTAQAAAIDVSNPGRAYISKAGCPPVEFQTATLHLPKGPGNALPALTLAVDCLAAANPPSPTAGIPGGSDVNPLARLMHQAWRETVAAGHLVAVAPAVVAAELPQVLAAGDLPDASRPDRSPPAASPPDTYLPGPHLALGLADVPQGQCLAPLRWHPGSQSHVACFGTVPETSRAVALVARLTLSGNARATANKAGAGPAGREEPTFVYLLDGDGALAPFATSPWTGAALTPDNLRAVAHLVKRLAHTVRNDPHMHLLCLTDWGRWVSALRSSPWHGTEDELAELVRFSPPNLAMAMGGGRELLSAAFLSAIPNRMFLSHGSNAESTMLWPRLPRFKPMVGRAAISGPINNFSLPHHGADDPGSGETLHIAQLLPPTGEPLRWGPATPGTRVEMLRVAELPSQLGMEQFRRLAVLPWAQLSREPLELLMGVGGDGLEPVTVRLAPGTVLPVLGGPGTGKSCFLRALAQLQAPHEDRTGAGGVLWLDDAPSLPPQALLTATQALAEGKAIVAALPYPGPALSTLPMEWGIRTAQQAVILMPQRPGDGDLFGVRLHTSGSEPPGRAVLLEHGRCSWFQFPLPGDAAAR